MFWGDKSDILAKQSLSQALTDIKRNLGDGMVLSCSQFVRINPEATEVDALDVTHLAGQTEIASLCAAEQLYQGEFLAGMELEQSDFDLWLFSERERLRQLVQHAITALLTRQPDSGDFTRTLELSRAALDLDPYDETAHRAMMHVHAQQGRKTLAARHFQKLTLDLDRELGVEPSEETVDLYNRIMSGAPLVRRPLPGIDDYAFIIEQLPQPVVVTDRFNKIVGWNGLSEDQFGFSKGEVRGRSPSVVFAPSDTEAVMRTAVRKGVWTGKVTLISRDGQPFQQRRTVAPLYGPDGELIGAFGYGGALENAIGA